MPFRYMHPQQKVLLPTIKKTIEKNGGIAAMTEISARTVRRTLKNYYDSGDLVSPRMGQVGRPRALTGLDMLSCRGGTAFYARGAAVATVAGWAVAVAASHRGRKEVDTGSSSKDMEAFRLQLGRITRAPQLLES
ncbi:hypothetical protein FB45DRAFT_1006439 [Roridomyces roridus]|uniref:Uncharacterized protein n=1 Tax=Roridomyces roridus TaxID=1738132 RepID=A0AAD7BGY1_9AGAR|nr:hypothetical protein FB45DRAFT_1006439 [Roridomyces roridus]